MKTCSFAPRIDRKRPGTGNDDSGFKKAPSGTKSAENEDYVGHSRPATPADSVWMELGLIEDDPSTGAATTSLPVAESAAWRGRRRLFDGDGRAPFRKKLRDEEVPQVVKRPAVELGALHGA
jgi:hypothetical protein